MSDAGDRIAVSVTEAAERIGVSPSYAYRLVRERKLPAIRTWGRRVVIPLRALEDYVNEQARANVGEAS